MMVLETDYDIVECCALQLVGVLSTLLDEGPCNLSDCYDETVMMVLEHCNLSEFCPLQPSRWYLHEIVMMVLETDYDIVMVVLA